MNKNMVSYKDKVEQVIYLEYISEEMYPTAYSSHKNREGQA